MMLLTILLHWNLEKFLYLPNYDNWNPNWQLTLEIIDLKFKLITQCTLLFTYNWPTQNNNTRSALDLAASSRAATPTALGASLRSFSAPLTSKNQTYLSHSFLWCMCLGARPRRQYYRLESSRRVPSLYRFSAEWAILFALFTYTTFLSPCFYSSIHEMIYSYINFHQN